MTLNQLCSELCSSTDRYCRRCFVGAVTEVDQCPPNVFRAENGAEPKPITFVFDKPNDNTRYKKSSLVPITIFDDRAGVDPRLTIAPSHLNLLALCRMLGIIDQSARTLSSPLVHITNAVKCDVSSETGATGRITLPSRQVRTCTNHFLANELEIVKSKAIVFFGTNAQRYVLDEVTPVWQCFTRQFAERDYIVMRVPHTSPQAFNTYGHRGQAYIEPFKKLQEFIA